MTHDMTKKKIEKTFVTYKKDENLQYKKKNIYEYLSLVYVWTIKFKGSHCQVEHIIKSLEVGLGGW